MGLSVGRYKLLHRIAVGGMAEIFLAAVQGEAGFQRKVIVKKILPHYAGEPEFVRRLVDEGLLASRLHHPNIVQVLDLGRLGPDYFIAMEFIDGIDARDMLARAADRGEPVPIPLAVHILWQVAKALAYAHERKSDRGEHLNIIHRDISPANIFISWDGAVKLGDFGIAKASQRLSRHTMTGVLQGKFPYMSPEQTEGKDLTQCSDVFSFGSVAYEFLSGARPFAGESDMQVLVKVKEAVYKPLRERRPDIPEALETVIHDCLVRDRDQRPPTGVEIERALAAVMQQMGWVFSETDVAAYLDALYGADKHSLAAQVDARTDDRGEIVEASPLDPYDLKAGLPTVGRRVLTTPPPEPTRAVPLPDWRRRARRSRRAWLLWSLFMAVVAGALLLDYFALHLLFEPTGGNASPPVTAADEPPRQAAAPPADVLEQAPPAAPDIHAAREPDIVTHADVGRETARRDVPYAPPSDARAAPDRRPRRGIGPDSRHAADVTTDAGPADVADREAPTADAVKPPPPRRSVTRITAVPADAVIVVNDRVLGTQPQSLVLHEHRPPVEIEVVHEGYETSRFELSYPAPRQVGKRLVKLPTGKLVLRYYPARAAVFIDGTRFEPRGGLNIIETRLPAGDHVISVRHDGKETTRPITIREEREWRGTITVEP